jgi:hypothetical protein
MSRVRFVGFLALILVSIAAYGAPNEVPGKAAASAIVRSDGDLPELPHVAKNQARPHPKARTSDDNQTVDNGWACLLDNSCPDGYDPNDPGYVAGACNCKRNCVSGNYGCSLGTNNSCKVTSGSPCTDCSLADCY